MIAVLSISESFDSVRACKVETAKKFVCMERMWDMREEYGAESQCVLLSRDIFVLEMP